MSRSLVVEAPAKINLFLRVLHRRDDGFRELETLFQTISLADEVRVTVGDFAAAGPSVSLVVDGPDLGPIESNLAHRAASAFRDATGYGDPVEIYLLKRIPAGAGLGGGSSDAAAVLRCLSRLANVQDPDLLGRVASELGSDVPFFLGESPLALGRGRGEVLTSLPALPEGHLVVALPPVHISTVAAYRALAQVQGEGDSHGGPRHFGYDMVGDWDQVLELMENDFEPVVAPAHPEIEASLRGLRDAGARAALLAGSGGAAFGLFENEADAGRVARALQQEHDWPFLPVRTCVEETRIRASRAGD